MEGAKIISKKQLYQYLKTLSFAVLALTAPDNTPYAVTIYFFVDQKLHFYFLTKSNTMKSICIGHSEKVALDIIDVAPKTVQITGTIEEVEDTKTYVKVLTKIATANAKKNGYYWPPPIAKYNNGKLIMYKIIPTWIRFGDFSKKTKEDTFYQVHL